MVCRGDLSDIAGPFHMGAVGGPDMLTLRRGRPVTNAGYADVRVYRQ
jgi:hypothetical protein